MPDTVLSTHSLCKNYKNQITLKNIDLDLYRRHIYGLIGKKGAGKTTLLRMLTGLAYPSSGSFDYFGLSNDRDLNKARARIGFIVDTPAFFEDMSVRDNMIAQSFNLRHIDKKRISALTKLLDIPYRSLGRQRLRHCTNSQRQRCALAMALLGNPEILILDEPFIGVDPNDVSKLKELLQKENEENRTTILITSATPGELAGFATDFIYMNKGQILAQTDSGCIAETYTDSETGRPDLGRLLTELISRQEAI